MAIRICPACHRPQGTSAECLSCREAVAAGLVREAKDVTPDAALAQAGRLERFLSRPPWYARAAPGALRTKLRLLWMVIQDSASGAYRKVPWKAFVALLAAAAWVLSPVDLVPDLLFPLGFTDDVLALAVTWGLVKRELRDYCQWKGLAPAHFGL